MVSGAALGPAPSWLGSSNSDLEILSFNYVARHTDKAGHKVFVACAANMNGLQLVRIVSGFLNFTN